MVLGVLALGGGVAALTQLLPVGAAAASYILLALGAVGCVPSYMIALRLYSARNF